MTGLLGGLGWFLVRGGWSFIRSAIRADRTYPGARDASAGDASIASFHAKWDSWGRGTAQSLDEPHILLNRRIR